MLDIGGLDHRHLAAALLSEEGDAITGDDLEEGPHTNGIDETETISRAPGRWEVHVSYGGLRADETTVFPTGRIVARAELAPGENDTYRNGMVVLFDRLVAGHHVILEGDHGGSDVNAKFEAYMIGTALVVPAEDGPRILAEAVARHRREVMCDIRIGLERITGRLQGADALEMRDAGVPSAFGALARLVARAA